MCSRGAEPPRRAIPTGGREVPSRRGSPPRSSRDLTGLFLSPPTPLPVSSPGWDGFGQGRQEKTLATHFLRPADFRAGENLRADEIPGGAGESPPRLLARNDGESSQGKASLGDFRVGERDGRRRPGRKGPQLASNPRLLIFTGPIRATGPATFQGGYSPINLVGLQRVNSNFIFLREKLPSSRAKNLWI